MHDDGGVFDDCQLSDQEFDDEIASIDSQTSVMDHDASNDIIDSQLNSKDFVLVLIFLKNIIMPLLTPFSINTRME